jgi:hypothetical protein
MKLPSGKHAYEILIFLIVILFAVYTHAQEPETEIRASSTDSETVLENQASSSPQDVAPPTETPANVRAERRAQLESRFQDRIFNLSRNISNRLQATVNRFENISNRLDTRIVKLKNSGVDTSSAEAKLGEARNGLDDARSKLGSLPSIQQALTSDTPRESFQKVRTIYVTTRDLLKNTHTLLSETVILLKNAPTQSTADTNTNVGTSTTETVE